jgi:EcsC protein family
MILIPNEGAVMDTPRNSSDRIASLLRAASLSAFRRTYRQVRLDPQRYFHQVRRHLGRPVYSWQDLRQLPDQELNRHADRVIKSSSRLAAFEGLGLGIGGLVTALPDFGILAAITIRMLQKLSLTYGFEYSTDDELASLWLAAASAAGLDLGREFLEKQAMERLVPKIVDQVALRAGAEVAEKWAARLVPILSAGTAGALNYWFVRSWGRRAQKHFLERRRSLRLSPGHSGPFLLPSPSPS